MRTVRMVKAMRLGPNIPLAKPGDVVEVDDDTYKRLQPRGVFTDPDAPAKPAADSGPEPADEPAKPVDQPADEPAKPVDQPADEPVVAELPPRTAPVEAWRDAAAARGIEVKGLSKRDIIAALS